MACHKKFRLTWDGCGWVTMIEWRQHGREGTSPSSARFRIGRIGLVIPDFQIYLDAGTEGTP